MEELYSNSHRGNICNDVICHIHRPEKNKNKKKNSKKNKAKTNSCTDSTSISFLPSHGENHPQKKVNNSKQFPQANPIFPLLKCTQQKPLFLLCIKTDGELSFGVF